MSKANDETKQYVFVVTQRNRYSGTTVVLRVYSDPEKATALIKHELSFPANVHIYNVVPMEVL